MADQFSGANWEIWYKVEPTTNGVMAVDAAGTPLSTTITAGANPGDETLTVAAITNADVGDTIRLGDDASGELLKIHSSTAPSGTTITLDPLTKVNFRHEAAEAVLETDPTADWFKFGNVIGFNPTSDRPLEESQAPAPGVRGISNVRLGSYNFGADITFEFDVEASPLWFYYAMNNVYSSDGVAQPTTPVNTTLDAAVVKGDLDFLVQVGLGASITAGDYYGIGAGTGQHVVKVSGIASDTITIDPLAHPNGFEKAHADDTAVDEVVAPFTHAIVKGSQLPVGLTLMLRGTEGTQESIAILYGNKINSFNPNVSGDGTISSFTVNTLCKRMQIMGTNVCGTPSAIDHKPYAQYEALIKVDAVAQVENTMTNLSCTFENNINAGRPIGKAIPGRITPGQGRLTGTFDYEYTTLAFAEKTQSGVNTALNITWTYILDSNHSLAMNMPTVKFGGNVHPAFSDLNPVSDSKSFTAIVSTTDVTITAKTNNPTIEYLVETA